MSSYISSPSSVTNSSFLLWTNTVMNWLSIEFILYLFLRYSSVLKPPQNNPNIEPKYIKLLHQQKIYSKYRRGNLKSTNILSKQIATLPIYPDMKKKEIEYIIKTVSKWYRKNK